MEATEEDQSVKSEEEILFLKKRKLSDEQLEIQRKYDRTKRKRAFQYHWLQGRPWLELKDEDGRSLMFCTVCKTYSADSPLGLPKYKNAFLTGCSTLKLESITIHEGSEYHMRALKHEMIKSGQIPSTPDQVGGFKLDESEMTPTSNIRGHIPSSSVYPGYVLDDSNETFPSPWAGRSSKAGRGGEGEDEEDEGSSPSGMVMQDMLLHGYHAGNGDEHPRPGGEDHHLDLETILDTDTFNFIETYADQLSVPTEYVFFPLLSLARSCIGKSITQVSPSWKDPGMLWSCVIGRHGSRRTSTLQYLVHQYTDHINTNTWTEASETPISEAVNEAKSKHWNIFSDDIVDVVFSASDVNQRCLKYGYDLGQLGIMGFATEEDLQGLCLDINVFPRLLLANPIPTEWKPCLDTEPQVDIDSIICTIDDCFRKCSRNTYKTFQLDKQAKAALDSFMSEMGRKVGNLGTKCDVDNLLYCIYSKATGQVVRVATCLSVLTQAVAYHNINTEDGENPWSFNIGAGLIRSAIDVVKHSLTQKLILIKGKVDSKLTPKLDALIKGKDMGAFVRNVCASVYEAGTTELAAPNQNHVDMLGSDSGFTERPNHTALDSYPNHVNIVNNHLGSIVNHANSPHKGVNSHHVQEQNLYDYQHQLLHGRNEAEHANSGELSNEATFAQEQQLPLLGYPAGRESEPVDTKQKLLEHLDPELQDFVQRYSKKIRKVLECSDYRLSPEILVERRMSPGLSRKEMVLLGTEVKFPSTVAKQFLQRLSQLGFGTLDTSLDNNSNNPVTVIFTKFSIDRLTLMAKAVLEYLAVTSKCYMAAFTKHKLMDPGKMDKGGMDLGRGDRKGADSSKVDSKEVDRGRGDSRVGDASREDTDGIDVGSNIDLFVGNLEQVDQREATEEGLQKLIKVEPYD